MKQYNFIDLFCGCGGLSKGFADAGFNVCLGIDNWKDAPVTYQHNFPSAKAMNDDVANVTAENILSVLNISSGSIDVIVGDPPCQGFSVYGKRLIDDERNKRYKSFVGFVNTMLELRKLFL